MKDAVPVREYTEENIYTESLYRFPIQRKLSVGAVDDPLENEADAMADKVMRMPEQNFIQRKCTHCEEEERAQRKPLASFIQKKSSLNNNGVISDSVSNQIQSTKNSGNAMHETTKSFMESRFGTDFSNVNIHTDNNASQLSNELNAQAFTVGNDIYFNDGKYQPESFAGKQLLAHELTHVLQQGRNTPSFLQRKTLSPPDLKAQEAELKRKFLLIRSTADHTQRADEPAKQKIKSLVKEFINAFAQYNPSTPARDFYEPEHYDTDDSWRHANIFSLNDAIDLSSRLQLLGLNQEAAALYKLGKPSGTIGIWEYDRPDTFYKDYTQAAIERIDISSPSAIADKLDILSVAIGEIAKRINGLDKHKIKSDLTRVWGNDIELSKAGFEGIRPFYLSLIRHIGELFTAMLKIVQKQMEKVFTDLDSSGEAPTIQSVENILTKTFTAFSKVKVPVIARENDEDSNKQFDPDKINVEPDKDVSVEAIKIDITKTDFPSKHKKHTDFFNDSPKAPSIEIEFYDRDQTEGLEKSIDVANILLIRLKQLSFIKTFYGLDNKGKRIKGKQGPEDTMPGNKFSLFSLDDWRIFVNKKFDDLTINRHATQADAFLTIIRLIQSYMKAFTIHTPFNIIDKGDNNYLTKTFPRALTGQLIHDCGVYALKTVYILSLLASKINLQMQYILLPNHVGLIIKGSHTPVVFVHNDDFTPIPLSQSQFDDLSHENQRLILSERGIQDYEKAKAAGDTSGFNFTLDKRKDEWLKITKDQNLKGPHTDEQFLAEQAANLYISQTDMPFSLVNIDVKRLGSKLKTGQIKKNLWNDYVKMVRDTVLFNEKAIQDKYSKTDQFNLRYLKITVAEKNFHNEILLPFWNNTGREKWLALIKQLQVTKDGKNEKAYLAALIDYQKHYLEDVDKLVKSYKPIADEKTEIHDIIAAKNPDPLQKGIDKTIGLRGRAPDWQTALIIYQNNLSTRIDNLKKNLETMNKGTDITAPFASVLDRLEYFP